MRHLCHKTILSLVVSLILIAPAVGQTTTNKNKNRSPQTTFSRKTIEGKEYYFYRIEENDVLDSIGLKFDVTPDIIIQYNPEIKQSPLTEGHLLIIPVRYNTAQIANAQKTFDHIVASGETLYSLSRMYGISINRITALNPGSEEVIKVGDTLKIPQNAIVGNPIQSQDAYVYHTVAKGETLYSLSKRYRTTVNHILKENPGITPETLNVGEVIRIASDNKELSQPQPKPEIFYYKVKSRKETIESVAEEFGVTVEDILAVNDGKDKVQRGNTVAIPKKVSKENATKSSVPQLNRIEKQAGEPYNIAIILPFMTGHSTRVQHSTPNFIKDFSWLPTA